MGTVDKSATASEEASGSNLMNGGPKHSRSHILSEILKLQEEEQTLRRANIEKSYAAINSAEDLVNTVSVGGKSGSKRPRPSGRVSSKTKLRAENKELKSLLCAAIEESKKKSEEISNHSKVVGSLDREITILQEKNKTLEQTVTDINIERQKVRDLEQQLTLNLVKRKQVEERLEQMTKTSSSDVENSLTPVRRENESSSPLDETSLLEENRKLKMLTVEAKEKEKQLIAEKRVAEESVNSLKSQITENQAREVANMEEICGEIKTLLDECRSQKTTIESLRLRLGGKEKKSDEFRANAVEQPASESPLPEANAVSPSSDTRKLKISLKKAEIRLERAVRENEDIMKRNQELTEQVVELNKQIGMTSSSGSPNGKTTMSAPNGLISSSSEQGKVNDENEKLKKKIEQLNDQLSKVTREAKSTDGVSTPLAINSSSPDAEAEIQKIKIDLKKSTIKLNRAQKNNDELKQQLSSLCLQHGENMNELANGLETVVLECKAQKEVICKLKKQMKKVQVFKQTEVF